MESAYEHWSRQLRGIAPDTLLQSWEVKSRSSASWTLDAAYHLAVAERFRRIGNMALDLSDIERQNMCRRGETILARLRAALADDPRRLAIVDAIVDRANNYYRTYGSRSARHYMFERGVIDSLGTPLG